MRRKNERKAALMQSFFVLAIICQNCALAVNWNSIEVNDVEFKIQTDKAVYELGENVEILYSITNNNQNIVSFDFSGSLPAFYVYVEQNDNVFWSDPYAWHWNPPFTINIDPGETIECPPLEYRVWDMIDYHGNLIDTGTYDLVGLMNTVPEVIVGVPFTVVPEPTSIAFLSFGLYLFRAVSKRKKNQ